MKKGGGDRASETGQPLNSGMIPYPAIHQHGVIGDRRTAALVAGDGTINWLCLPHYGGDIVFGALLDARKGGYWKLGPVMRALAEQCYLDSGPLLRSLWDFPEGNLELLDFMPWPENRRTEEMADAHVVARRLRVLQGSVDCICDFKPRINFRGAFKKRRSKGPSSEYSSNQLALSFWTNAPIDSGAGEFMMHAGDEFWFVLSIGDGASRDKWDTQRLESLAFETEEYWRTWTEKLHYDGPSRDAIFRTAQVVHLLSYAPCGSIVAAPTTSLPERIGGDWNADYRFSWVRDASLCMGMMVAAGNNDDPQSYMHWLTTVSSKEGSPLQVMYGMDGNPNLPQRNIQGVAGYRNSPPVRVGNRAYTQVQLDSLGYLVDCAWAYLNAGGEWKEGFWDLIRQAADYTCASWAGEDHSIWELPVAQHYVSSKVMSWVALERSVRIAQRLHPGHDTRKWREAMRDIYNDVMEKGWSERLGAFTQRYETESLDSAVLLIPVMGFLPPDHPRVLSTIRQVASRLTIDGFVYRFDPQQTPGLNGMPMGEFEAAFLPCTFWLATAYSMSDSPDAAERILKKAESYTGANRLFAEAADPRAQIFMGNFPLLFSQVEYARALAELDKARSRATQQNRHNPVFKAA